jgi:hypothetical protein
VNCKICGSEIKKAFERQVLGKYQAVYCKCESCGFLYAKDPFWLPEAYETTITSADTGLLSRNISYHRKAAVLIYNMLDPDGCYLDYGGGYGVFTRLMRDAGFEFFHTDPYTQNLFAKDCEWDRTTKIDGVTCFELFEHLADPMQEIRQIVSISKTVIFSTEVLPEEIPPVSWEYYGFGHGQHISFYSNRTLQFIANELGVHWANAGGLHLFSQSEISATQMRALIRKTNRPSHWFSRSTTFQHVVKSMRKEAKELVK